MNNDKMFSLKACDLTIGNLDHNLTIEESEELNQVNKFFESITLNNKELETLLYEIIGYCMTRDTKMCKSFVFKGSGRNGKSKIFRIIENLLVSSKCSHEHLENICGTKPGAKTTVKNLDGCCVNISEDQKPLKYVNTSLLTRIISGEPISVGNKDIIPYCKLLFSVNEVVDFHETGLHIKDRIMIIPFLATFTDENNNRDINIEKKLCQQKSLRIIATKALEAFDKAAERGQFTMPQIVIDETKKYFLECNNVDEFCSLYPIETIIIKSDYYDQYLKWCLFNNYDAVSNSVFGKGVLALGYRAERYSINNDRKTYYANPNFDNKDFQKVCNNYKQSITLSSEEASNRTDEELAILCEQMPTFDEYLNDNIHLSELENFQDPQDADIAS